MNRQFSRVISEYLDLPHERVPVPLRERLRRCRRDRTLRHLRYTHETRIVWPKGREAFGIKITKYAAPDADA